MTSIPLAVPRPKCSKPASKSTITTSSLFTSKLYNKVLIKAFSGHKHPEAGSTIPPNTSNCNPFGPVTLNLSGISDTFGVML
ncbi:hypothetical protein ES705_11714 [subsurface metagenome]